MQSWRDNEDILSQFREWLTQTAEELEQPADDASFGEADDGSHPDGADSEDSGAPHVGLLRLGEAFSAMRHEVKLHTKGARNLEETVSQSLERLEAASRLFKSVQAKEREAVERVALPMVEAIIEFHESLRRAERAFQAARHQLTEAAPTDLRQTMDSQFAAQRWWRRLKWRRWHAHLRDMACTTLRETAEQEFANLMEGFRMIQTRLARALTDGQIRRIDETGGQVDPTRMTVVELVRDSNLPPETVIEVVRAGYLWGDRVVRYAEVRAVSSQASEEPATFSEEDQDVVAVESLQADYGD